MGLLECDLDREGIFDRPLLDIISFKTCVITMNFSFIMNSPIFVAWVYV